MNNRTGNPKEQIVIGLKVVSMPAQDKYQREVLQIRSEYALDKAQEMIEEKTLAMVESAFVSITGLEIEGFEDKELDFHTFYREAPPELVNWVIRAVMSTTELSLAERKNWLPGSDTAS
jgi:antitoxin component HigA of HigAB toxin-antitoxin module